VPGKTEVLEQAIERWVADPESAVEYSELVEGRWATRMRQEVRDATTVWWEPDQRTLKVEAYVAPSPPNRLAEVYRLCLARNASTYRTWFALDTEDGIVLRARIATEDVTPTVLDQVLGELYEQIELTFPHIVRLGFAT
jgi:hypothetical protein